ncbi:MAG: helix-turn-helix transcriptional regulator [Lachnospiraceae bacterium]|nr:helix-turn-helix transcriptional regulator [Lachnospiraceae bacterium]
MKNHDEKFIKIGLNIAYYRKLRKMTQLELAEKANLSRTHISNIEAPNMITSISIETLLDIAEALEIPASHLLDFTR